SNASRSSAAALHKTWDYPVTPGRQVPEEASPTTNCFTAPKPALPMLQHNSQTFLCHFILETRTVSTLRHTDHRVVTARQRKTEQMTFTSTTARL
uniref:Uncharacterized protein n=1 Tax=Pavo cristatus TaxID=9049 RepID=A0A8C9F438_PAVCR